MINDLSKLAEMLNTTAFKLTDKVESAKEKLSEEQKDELNVKMAKAKDDIQKAVKDLEVLKNKL
jgi:dsDNA-binding SOS-regulon protein